jgi:hypothetical protein
LQHLRVIPLQDLRRSRSQGIDVRAGRGEKISLTVPLRPEYGAGMWPASAVMHASRRPTSPARYVTETVLRFVLAKENSGRRMLAETIEAGPGLAHQDVVFAQENRVGQAFALTLR